MKALVITLFLLGSCTLAHAQMKDRYAERPGAVEPFAAQVEQMTRLMSKQLHLNEAQVIQMRAVNRVKVSRAEEIQWQFQDNVEQRNAHLAELEALYETECRRILTPSQLSVLHDDKQRDAVPVPVNSSDGGLG